jgi:hypothetical protein
VASCALLIVGTLTSTADGQISPPITAKSLIPEVTYDSKFSDPGTPRILSYGAGFVSTPADATTAPAYSAQQAIAAADAQGFDEIQIPGNPKAAIRWIDYDAAGGQPAEGEKASPVVHRLSWVLVYYGSKAQANGPKGSGANLQGANCEWTTIVDAMTDEVYFNNQHCGS